MTNRIDRRAVLKNAAWSVPVIAAAVGTPLAEASPKCGKGAPVYNYNPASTKINRGQNDKAIVQIKVGVRIQITYPKGIDSVNVQYKINDKTTVVHLNRGAIPGEILDIDLLTCDPVQWVRVHGNNVEYYGQGVFA